MSGQLAGAGLGAALAMTAAAASVAFGVSPHHGGVLVLLLSVLVAARWRGRIAGYGAASVSAVLAPVLLRMAGQDPSPGADVTALAVLGFLAAGIAAWTGAGPLAGEQRHGDTGRHKEEFLATVSHELRTPLNAILGWTELLRTPRGVTPQQVDRGLEVIERNARRQLGLVEELLDAADPATASDEWRPVDVREMLQALLDELAPHAAASHVALGVDDAICAPESAGVAPRPWVCGDAASLRTALRHILDNAIKYTPAGGQVRASVRQSGPRILIFVSDTGGGIAPGDVEHVFEPFNQIDNSAARPHGGLGLGLTIARKLIERHGGHVDLGSDVAGGSTVLVTLPSC